MLSKYVVQHFSVFDIVAWNPSGILACTKYSGKFYQICSKEERCYETCSWSHNMSCFSYQINVQYDKRHLWWTMSDDEYPERKGFIIWLWRQRAWLEWLQVTQWFLVSSINISKFQLKPDSSLCPGHQEQHQEDFYSKS